MRTNSRILLQFVRPHLMPGLLIKNQKNWNTKNLSLNQHKGRFTLIQLFNKHKSYRSYTKNNYRVRKKTSQRDDQKTKAKLINESRSFTSKALWIIFSSIVPCQLPAAISVSRLGRPWKLFLSSTVTVSRTSRHPSHWRAVGRRGRGMATGNMTSKMSLPLSKIGALGTGVIPSFFMDTEDVSF